MASRQVAARYSVAAKYSAGSKHKAIRLSRAVRAIARSGADAARRPAHCQLDCVENDYYRFLNYPRD